jgi:molybdopterin-synthase adenylyltransferase
VDRLVSTVDLVIDAAPMFEERFAMNRAAVVAGKPMVECAMYELEAQITTILPGRTACLRCMHPGVPPEWKREFPVFGAVSASVGCMAAMEAIKLIAGFGEPLAGRLLTYDLRDMTFRTLKVRRDPECEVCGRR